MLCGLFRIFSPSSQKRPITESALLLARWPAGSVLSVLVADVQSSRDVCEGITSELELIDQSGSHGKGRKMQKSKPRYLYIVVVV